MALLKHARILHIVDEGPLVKSFVLHVDEPVDFKPGQFITTFIDQKKAAFSISSCPSQRNDLQITVKLHEGGVFTPLLFSKSVGDPIDFMGPFGAFTFNEGENTEYYLIAGGIGITPFRSIVRYIRERQLSPKVNLIYSARTKHDLTYFEELRALPQPQFSTYFTLTDEDWDGPSGILTKSLLDSLVKNKSALMYVCGTPGFNAAMTQSLKELGVAEDNIRLDVWEL